MCVFIGERSCIGVPILIDGANGGASLACNLPQSCRLAHVTGNNVNMVRCGADRSCMNYVYIYLFVLSVTMIYFVYILYINYNIYYIF